MSVTENSFLIESSKPACNHRRRSTSYLCCCPCWQITSDDDVVSMGLKRLCCAATLSVLSWLISFVLIVLQITNKHTMIPVNAVLFAPMWFGSVTGIVFAVLICIKVCKNATLVSRERREFMSVIAPGPALFIDYDSLPLLRRLFCLNFLFVATLLVVLVAQMLFYMWFVDVISDIWRAVIPVCVLTSLFLAYMYLIKVYTLSVCGVVSLLVLQLVRLFLVSPRL